MERKVQGCVDELNTLSAIAKTQSPAAFAAFTHGLCSKWNYALRVTNLESTTSTQLLQPLENTIHSNFVPALTGLPPPGKLTRNLLALPCKLGGLGLVNPTDVCSEQHSTSKLITVPLVNLVVKQEACLGDCLTSQQHEKTKARTQKRLKKNTRC